MTPTAIADRALRQREIIPPDRLATCRATVIGIGAIGRQVALQLAAIGLPSLHLIDPDRVEEAEGRFPDYREVVPETQSRFVVDRLTLVEALRQVALATGPSQPAVRLDLGPRSIRLSAETSEVGRSTAAVRSTFAGGGDDCLQTGFAPGYLLDALTNLSADRVVIDVAQNTLGLGGRVRGHAALFHGEDDPTVRWVVMPVDLGLEPGPESLGSNHREQDQAA